jgi:phosphoglycolate phosphatase
MPEKKLIIFDFDGVLVNTGQFWFARVKDTNQNMTWERFAEMSEGSFIERVTELVQKNEVVYDYTHRAPYTEHLESISIHDALHAMVTKLGESNMLSIVSSAYTSEIENFLKKENIHHHFTDVLGVDVDSNKTRKIKSLLEKYSLLPHETVYVTDTLGDVREAKHAEVISIGVTWGIHDKEALQKGEPFSIVDTVPDLEIAIATFFENTVQ